MIGKVGRSERRWKSGKKEVERESREDKMVGRVFVGTAWSDGGGESKAVEHPDDE